MSQVSYAQITLDYPPWALEFDPYNRGYLLVGGGGGQGQKEVPNKLTLLDLQDRSKITKAAELEVKDDSPSSLGLLASKQGFYAYSGINSAASRGEKSAGPKDHFRSFHISFPTKTRGATEKSGTIEAFGKATLFESHYAGSSDAFQRLLRLSPPHLRATGNKRLGAIASSLSSESEIVVFDATVASPTKKDVIHSIRPEHNAEANDLDIFDSEDGSFKIAYCTNSAVYLTTIAYDFSTTKLKSKPAAPAFLWGSESKGLAKFGKLRALRFLSKNLLLALINKGAESELVIFKIFTKGGPADLVLRKRLPKRVGSAVSLDVSALGADEKTGVEQVVIAVAAQAKDIHILTVDLPQHGTPKTFKDFTLIKNVHDAPMKKVILSHFHSPHATGATAEALDKKRELPDQFIRLASISLANTLVVENLQLVALPAPKSTKQRYVLDKSGPLAPLFHHAANLFVLAVALAVSLVLAQSVLDASAHDKTPGARSDWQLIPETVRTTLRSMARDADPVKAAVHDVVAGHASPLAATGRIADIVSSAAGAATAAAREQVVVIRPALEEARAGALDLAAEVHADAAALAQDKHAVRWEELSAKQQETWRRRLVKAGQWSKDEGEKVLKGVFFSEVAGAVGRAALGAIN